MSMRRRRYRAPLVAGALILIVGVTACGGSQPISGVRASLARVAGTACLKPILATAVVVEDGLLLTVAHAIAGAEQDLRAVDLEGTEREVLVVAFDPARDLALLAVDGFDDPIDVVTPKEGGAGIITAVNGDLEVDEIAYRINRIVTASSGDIYDEGQVLRQALDIEAEIGPGDSGAPLLDARGAMVGVVFATSTGVAGSAWALHASEIEAFLGAPRTGAEVDRGRCR